VLEAARARRLKYGKQQGAAPYSLKLCGHRSRKNYQSIALEFQLSRPAGLTYFLRLCS